MSSTKPLETRTPAAAIYLGALGLVPFLGLSLISMFPNSVPQEAIYAALVGYGAVILSFLGGVQWGLAICGRASEREDGARFAPLIVSVVPALVGWTALLIPEPLNLILLSIGFLGALAVDLNVRQGANVPAWYPKLRLPLTMVVLACLVVAAGSLTWR